MLAHPCRPLTQHRARGGEGRGKRPGLCVLLLLGRQLAAERSPEVSAPVTPMAMVAPSCENVLSLVDLVGLSVLEVLWHDHDLPGLLSVVVCGPVDDVEDEEEDGEEDEEEAVHLGVALPLPTRHAVLVVVPEEEIWS